MWHLQRAVENADHEPDATEVEDSSPSSEIEVSHEHSLELSPGLKKVIDDLSEPSGETEQQSQGDSGLALSASTAEDVALVPQPVQELAKSPWGSADKARSWLESLHPKSPGGIWLAKHRADLYVGAAVLLLLIVLSGWGMRPAENHVQPKNPPQPSLTLFEKLLVSLGLAETPPAPVYLGNPNAQVWVDLHTALYYCAGSDLYGKTPGGKFTTQRDAQMDQFEPAARKNCD
jgi:hypothetical protein